MEKTELNSIKESLQIDLSKQLISSRILLDRLLVIDENSRKSPAYLDPNYAAFYYHLGKYFNPQSMAEFGFDLGLLSSCFLVSCKTVEKFFGYREKSKQFASTRLGQQNIRKNCKGEKFFHNGEIYDTEFESIFDLHSWDMVLLTDEAKYDKYLEYFDHIWQSLNENGIIVVENITKHAPAKEAFNAFSKSKNRQSLVFSTRYGTGIMQK